MNEFRMPRVDERELFVLGTSHEADHVPSEVTEFAKAAYSWRSIEAPLAPLDFDSGDDIPRGYPRWGLAARLMSFLTARWLIDIEYHPATGLLVGAISPETPCAVDLHTGGVWRSADSVGQGRFSADGVATGPFSMVLRLLDGSVFKTQWILL